MKKLTAKDLLKEVQSIRKQASSAIKKPEVIEYGEEEYDYEQYLRELVQKQVLDKMKGSWFGSFQGLSAEIEGDKVRVKVTGEFLLDAKKIPWYEQDIEPIDMYEEVASILGTTLTETDDAYVTIDDGYYSVGLNLDIAGNPVAVDQRTGNVIVWSKDLSGNAYEDIDLLVSKIRRHF